MESSDAPLEECLKAIEGFLPLFPGARRTDWNRTLELRKEELQAARVSLADLDAVVKHAGETLAEKRAAWEEFKAGYDGFCSGYEDRSAGYRPAAAGPCRTS